MSAAGEPALSAILVSASGGPEVARTFELLRAQTAAAELEVVLVGRDGPSLRALAASGEELAAVRVVVRDPIESTGQAFADGFAASSGAAVVCSEEHSFPEPDWAQAYIAAFETHPEAVAVGAGLDCENPDTAVSWAHLLSDFGPAVSNPPAGWAQELPGHHTAYRRAVLEGLGDALASWLEIEWILHEELHSRGEKLWLEPAVRTSHTNVSLIRSQMVSEYQAGRSFGALRAELRDWPTARRWVFSALAPLVLLLRLWRTGREAARADVPVATPALVGTMLLGLTLNVAGQAVGAVAGIGRSRSKRLTIEVERYKHLKPDERRRYEPLTDRGSAESPPRLPSSR